MCGCVGDIHIRNILAVGLAPCVHLRVSSIVEFFVPGPTHIVGNANTAANNVRLVIMYIQVPKVGTQLVTASGVRTKQRVC